MEFEEEQSEWKGMEACENGTRAKIMAILARGPATMKELVNGTGEKNIAVVAYHARVLRELGAVERDDDEGDDGGVRYRAKR